MNYVARKVAPTGLYYPFGQNGAGEGHDQAPSGSGAAVVEEPEGLGASISMSLMNYGTS